MSLQTLTRGRRLLSGATVAALTAGLFAFAPTSAQAAADVAAGATLQWKVSGQFAGHLGEHTLSGGATETADKVISFVQGKTSYEASTGRTVVDYRGSVTGAFVNADTKHYQVTITNPAVEVAADGAGRITADVSSEQFTSQGPGTIGASTPSRVTVTTFTAASSSFHTNNGVTTVTGTPEWSGVLAAGSDAALGLGISPDRPVDGKSFAPEFLEALWPSTRPHFYWTSGSDAKAPAAFAAEIAPVGAPVAANVSTQYAKGAKISVTAPLPGRVTVAGIGTKTATAANQTLAFSVPKKTTAGTKRYTVTLVPSVPNLSPAATTVTVKIAKRAAYKAKLKVNKKPTRKAKGKATVTVRGVAGGATTTGKVRLKLSKGKQHRFVTVNLVKGKRTVKLPKLAKGKWVVRAAYLGNANYTKRGYVKVGSFKVTK